MFRVQEEKEDVEDQVHYNNPNFVKRIEPQVQFEDAAGPEYLDDTLDLVLKRFDDTEVRNKLVWLLQTHRDETLKALGVSKVDEIRKRQKDIIEKEFQRQRFVKRLKIEYRSQDAIQEEKDRVLGTIETEKAISTLRNFIASNYTEKKEGVEFTDDAYTSELRRLKAVIIWNYSNLVVDDANVDEVFAELITKDDKFASVRIQLADLSNMETRLVHKMEEVLDVMMKKAMQPLYLFIGMMDATEQYGKKHWAHYYPIIKGSNTLAQFRLKNTHIGSELLLMAADYVHYEAGYRTPIDRSNVTFIGVQFPAITVNQKKIIKDGGFKLDMEGAPEWIWCMVGNPCIQFMLANQTYGAITMAAYELGQDNFKVFLDAENIVTSKFAEFCARMFFTSKGGNAQASGISGDRVQYRISSGFGTVHQSNTKWLMAARLWFRDCYFTSNPNRQQKIDESVAMRDLKKAEYDQRTRDYQDLIAPIPPILISPVDLMELNQATIDTLRLNNYDVGFIVQQHDAMILAKKEWETWEIKALVSQCAPERILRKGNNRPSRFIMDNQTNVLLLQRAEQILRNQNQ